MSISSGLASATFTHAFGAPAHVDSRLWLGVDSSLVEDYFLWRQSDAAMCALNGWSYWLLRRSGKSAQQATEILNHRSISFTNERLFQFGMNYNDLRAWQRRGVGLYFEQYERNGYNPREDKKVTTIRRRIKIDYELPMRDDDKKLVNKILRPWMQATTS